MIPTADVLFCKATWIFVKAGHGSISWIEIQSDGLAPRLLSDFLWNGRPPVDQGVDLIISALNFRFLQSETILSNKEKTME